MSHVIAPHGGDVSSRSDFPAHGLVAVTPSDSVVQIYRGLYVGTAGNVAVIGLGDTAGVTLVAVPAGSILPIAVSKVLSTGTTASNIVGLI